MQLADNSEADSNQDGWIAAQRQSLAEFAGEIEDCLLAADWDALSEVLDRRQSFLQQVFNPGATQTHRAQLAQLAGEILAEDAEFVARIEAEKQLVSQQHQLFEHSRKALKAYGGL